MLVGGGQSLLMSKLNIVHCYPHRAEGTVTVVFTYFLSFLLEAGIICQCSIGGLLQEMRYLKEKGSTNAAEAKMS